ncbi:methyltransferase [Parafrankia soli]|uniref:Methyltransferase n=1 Tax=Parafrankia soli TaxID=2599596 RepID=A0A1S1PDE5_9ACTN|nr:methyltransferase [Parafrankia soli]
MLGGRGVSDTPTGHRRWKTLVDKVDTVELRTDAPHSARMYDYYLGGKDNFPADREGAEQAIAVFPTLRDAARENRAFLVRAIRYLAGEAGIRQFLDIGTGIPTSPNLHEVAQGIAPDARVVYADNDPIVLAHARALLTSTPEGRTVYLDADVRNVDQILAAPALRDTLDLTRPVALSLLAVLPFVEGDAPYTIVRNFLDALPAGSYLVLSHGTADLDPNAQRIETSYRERGLECQFRSRAEVERLFDGLTLVDPGVQVIHRWRPDGTADHLSDAEVCGYCGVGRK